MNMFKQLIGTLEVPNCTEYKIYQTEESTEYRLEFEIHEVISWFEDETLEEKKVIYGFIKWDGCSYIALEGGGYIHLCGKQDWYAFQQVLDIVWKLAEEKITKWDAEVDE